MKKSTILLGVAIVIAVVVITFGVIDVKNRVSRPVNEAVKHQSVAISATGVAPVKPQDSDKKTSKFKAVETNQSAIEEELSTIPQNPIGKIVALQNGKHSLVIGGKSVMEAREFVFSEKHPSGNIFIGAISKPGVTISQFDIATDINKDGKANVATTDFWWLRPDGRLKRITADNTSVNSFRMSDSGKMLAYSVENLNEKGFSIQQTLYVMDVKTEKVFQIYQTANTSYTVGPVTWIDDDTLRVYTGDAHGMPIKIETVKVQ